MSIYIALPARRNHIIQKSGSLAGGRSTSAFMMTNNPRKSSSASKRFWLLIRVEWSVRRGYPSDEYCAPSTTL